MVDRSSQSRLLEDAATAPGSTTSSATLAVATVVHPFKPVTVSVYRPSVLMFGSSRFEVKFGPVQAKVAPGVVEIPFRFRLVVVQVNVPPCADAFGGIIF